MKVKKAYYHENYAKKSDPREASLYDFGVLELEEDLAEEYGFLGIDTRKENIDLENDIEVCGYPAGKKKHMFYGEGKCKGVNEDLILYNIPEQLV